MVPAGKRKGLSMAGGLRIDSLADLPERMRAQAAGKMLAQGTAVAAEKAADAAGTTPKESKYHNVKVELGQNKFDSKKEYRRFLQLQEAARCGLIEDLRLQVDFTLQEAYTTTEGERIKAIRYRADFTYRIRQANYGMAVRVGFEDLDYWRSVAEQKGPGALVVEDVKSKATKTGEYQIKRKLMAEQGYSIREV